MMPNVPPWFAPPVVLPTTAGMHRIAWDLRYRIRRLNYGYGGSPPDYREYCDWHALPGRTPVSTGRAHGASRELHRGADG
jgi:hypothetical protein